jgi:4-carboxymuconolactone decarboxylase
VCRALSLYGHLDDQLFNRAKARLGETGLIELVALCGYYTMLAMLLNTAGTPPVAGGPDPF